VAFGDSSTTVTLTGAASERFSAEYRTLQSRIAQVKRIKNMIPFPLSRSFGIKPDWNNEMSRFNIVTSMLLLLYETSVKVYLDNVLNKYYIVKYEMNMYNQFVIPAKA